ncbi:CDP-glycerol glycerophosphotransferase family protein, partial [Catenulispora sp. NF23]|uniref:CDP-glycerol glycerophosphotransferase family protein n=1 Tax=Catenulispora pinistramenti TaxID=2705254 RepID=UPI001BABB94A
RAEPSRAEPSRAEPSRAEPSRAEPSRAEPSRAEPSRAEPSRAVFGLSEPWVLHEGVPIATAQVLSHFEQLDRFRKAAPTVAHTAVVAGDPCFDRLLESAADRDLYRAALGLRDGRRLVVVNTTWGPRSLFGQQLALVERLVAELPVDDYLVAAVVHPNVGHAHGRAEVERVLAHARRGGLLLVPPFDWRAALLAADALVGDHGSVPFYAAALGVPTILATFPTDALDPESPIARFAGEAPHLVPGSSLRDQIEKAIHTYTPAEHADVTGSVTSFPGRSLELLRALFYGLLELPEPPWPAIPDPVPVLHHHRQRVSPLWARVVEGHVERFPSAVDHATTPRDRAHLVVDATQPTGRAAEMADVLIRDAHEAPEGWAARAFDRLPGLTVAGLVEADRCRLRLRDGTEIVRHAAPGQDPAVLASVLYNELVSGGRHQSF